MRLETRRGYITALSRLSGVPRQTVSDVIKGRTANPGIHTVRRIEAAIAQLEAERAGKVEQGLGNGSGKRGAGEGE